MMNKLIELKNLTKNFDDQQVLRGINLDIYEKEFLTLLGPSGCGKTTTLRIIAGFEEPSDGEVLFNGIEISKLPPYKREVNTVFQKYALFPHLNVAENIGFGLNLKKVDKTVIAQKVERMLKMVGLEGFGKRDVTLLSGGQQQRVAIARALVNEPKVLLLDEPLGALDAKIRKQMQVELKKIQQEVGITFIYVTHDQEEALSMSDTVVVMNNGEIQQIEKENVNLSELTEMIVGEQQFLAESKGNAGQIICHIEPEIWAEVDETLYIRMMINLLSNALRYGEGRDIEVSLSVHNDSDIIGKVKDHGIGISKGDIPHIWERFYRADKSRTGGSHCGLGLSMVKWIAEAHGGSVEVVSKEGEGSEFVFHLRKSKS